MFAMRFLINKKILNKINLKSLYIINNLFNQHGCNNNLTQHLNVDQYKLNFLI